MAKRVPTFITLGAVDRISKVLTRVASKFPKLSKAAKRASLAFAIMQKKTEKLRKSLSKVGSKMKSVGQSMTAGLTAPIGLAGAGILKVGLDFNKSMNRVNALTRNVVGNTVNPLFDKLKQQAKDLGSTTVFSASQVADGMGFLAQAGFDAKEIYDAMPATLDLAAASGTELAATADIMSNIMGAFGKSAKDATSVADVLSLTTSSSNVNMEQLAETMKVAGPIANKFGASLEETASLAGLLGNVGIQGSLAGTALKTMFLKIATPSARAKKMFQEMGIALTDGAGGMKNASQIFKEAAPQIAALNKNEQLEVLNELFGLRGIAGGAELMTQAMKKVTEGAHKGKNEIEALTDKLKNAQGASAQMAGVMNAGATGAFNNFKSALEGVGIAFAESGLLEVFSKVLGKMTEFFQFLKGQPQIVLKTIAIIGALVAVIGPLIGALGFMVSGFGALLPVFAAVKAGFIFFMGLLPAFGTILAGIKIAIAAVGTVLGVITAPVWLVVAAIGALIAGLIRAFFAWDKLVAAFKSGKGFLDTTGKVLKTFFGFGDDEEAAPGGAAGGKATGALGAPVGAARAVTAAANQSVSTVATNNAAVEITLKGDTKGVRTKTSGTAPLTLNTGFQGGAL